MDIVRYGSSELYRPFRITGQVVHFSGERKLFISGRAAKAIARRQPGARYENALSHWGATRNRVI